MKSRQGGAAVLATVLVLLILTVLLKLYAGSAAQSVAKLEQGRGDALAVAREALIEYSVNYPSHYLQRSAGPGHLPCPDTNGNGSPALVCGMLPIGLLPVDFGTKGGKNVSFLVGQALSAEPIWYVISSAFRYNPAPAGAVDSATVVNSDTQGELQLDGESGLIAILIAPGPVLSGQSRGGNFSIENYLEGENADGDAVFSSTTGNDRLLALRWRDLMPLVERRVLATAKESVSAYRISHGHMPWLSPTERGLLGSESVCSPCQWRGWLATERFYRNQPWPGFSRQSCVDHTRSENQPTVQLPAWFVSNYWHRYIWLQVVADDRGGVCEVVEKPQLDGVQVDAVLASVGRALKQPEHGLVEQSHFPQGALLHYLDGVKSVDGDGAFISTRLTPRSNDQWSELP